MKLQSNSATLIANSEMGMALIQVNGKNIFLSHDELMKLGDILNEWDNREEIRDLINDYKEMIFKEVFESREDDECPCCKKTV